MYLSVRKRWIIDQRINGNGKWNVVVVFVVVVVVVVDVVVVVVVDFVVMALLP